MAKQLKRTLATLDYEAGSSTKIDLPREHFYERLNLLLDYDVTVNSTGSKKANGVLDLVDSIKVEYNGNTTPKSTSFAMSHYVDHYSYGSRPVFDPIDWSTASQQSGRAQTYVQMLLAPNSYGAMLPSFLFSGLTLEVSWANPSDIGDVDVNSASVKVESTERKRNSIPQSKQQKVINNLAVFKERELRRTIDRTGDNQIELPAGNVYHSLPFQVIDDGSPDDELVDEIEILENGVDTHIAVDWDLQQADDYQSYQIDEPVEGVVFPSYAVGADTSDAVDTSGMDSYNLHLNTGSAAPTNAEVRLVTREIITG